MGILDKPILTVKENLKLCVTRVVRENFGTSSYYSVRKKMIDDEASYTAFGQRQQLHLYSPSRISKRLAKKAEVLYDNRMVDKSGTGRANYDQLRMRADICPYCLERTAETLDHYLPKTRFPLLSITPVNLIPCCESCNHKKRDEVVSNQADQFIHPYFETLFGFE